MNNKWTRKAIAVLAVVSVLGGSTSAFAATAPAKSAVTTKVTAPAVKHTAVVKSTTAKAPAKAVVKTPAKVAVKTPAKAVVKTTVKAPAKTTAKAPAKAVVKTPAKAPAKTTAKTPAKPKKK